MDTRRAVYVRHGVRQLYMAGRPAPHLPRASLVTGLDTLLLLLRRTRAVRDEWGHARHVVQGRCGLEPGITSASGMSDCKYGCQYNILARGGGFAGEWERIKVKGRGEEQLAR